MSSAVCNSPVVVASTDEDIRTTRSLAMVVNSIFNQERFRPIAAELLEMLRASDNDQSFRKICIACEQHLLQKLLQSDATTHGTVSAALNRLRLVSLRADDSEAAYKAHLKPNWKAVYWPNPGAPEPHGRNLCDEDLLVHRKPLIDQQTPIGSAGSCFATEIAQYLKSNRFNYILAEPNIHSCAAWGHLYNTPSFRQLMEFAFGIRQRPKLLFKSSETGKPQYWDPFREEIIFDSIEEYEQSMQQHLPAARKALTEAKVFVMTVGLNEVWRLQQDDWVIARYPRSLASYLVYKEILSVEQNVAELQRMFDIWRAHNPDVKLIVTLSPVPLYATFRGDECHVVQANCHSKSTLRVAIEEFVRRNADAVTYFPAYEVVTYCSPTPFESDGRHVTRDTVQRVTQLFERMFLKA